MSNLNILVHVVLADKPLFTLDKFKQIDLCIFHFPKQDDESNLSQRH